MRNSALLEVRFPAPFVEGRSTSEVESAPIVCGSVPIDTDAYFDVVLMDYIAKSFIEQCCVCLHAERQIEVSICL